ncbi:MAG: FAD-dependent oxidoreductase [Myxococcales bacterium]
MSRVSRREMLTALVGAPVAAWACRRPPPRREFGGALLGQNAALGHRLRDGFHPEPTERRQVGVVIVGGGVSGLSAGWKLARSGFDDFVVLELEERPGGTSASGENAASAFPWGAHYVPVPLPENRALAELLREVGAVEATDARGQVTIAEELLCASPQERLFLDGRWYEGLYPRAGATTEDLRQLHAFEAEIDRWIDFRDGRGRRGFTLPSASCGEDAELDALDRLSVADWLRQKGWSSPRLRWYLRYACRDDYGLEPEETSAWAGVFYFAARAAKAGVKSAEYVTWPEGNGRLVRHLAEACGRSMRLGAAVTDILPRENGLEVRAFEPATGKATAYLAGEVIFALPKFLASRLVAPWRERPPAWLADFGYGSWMVANLTLRGRPRETGFPLAWDNVIYESPSLGYVDATHQTGRDRGPTVWTYYLPLTRGTPAENRRLLFEASWEHWADAILSDLSRPHPDLEGRLERLDVWRWGHAMVRPAVGLLRGEALRRAREPLGRLHFANTDLSGLALFEEAQHWGIAAAEDILGARGLPFRSSL